MCFSTTASFVSAAILTTVGVATIKKTQSRNQFFFASIPFIFALQQFSEGFVWLSLINSNYSSLEQLSTYAFLTFALLVWPVWVPLSQYLIEKQAKRKNILFYFSALGILFSILSLIYLFSFGSKAYMTDYHIHYELRIPVAAKIIFGILYLIPTVFSNFVASTKGVFLMGVFILVSYAISRLFFNDHVLSVWCFFSALISINIYFILARERKLNLSEKTSELES